MLMKNIADIRGVINFEKMFIARIRRSAPAGYYSATVYSISAYQDFQSGNDMNGIGNIINAGMSIYMTKGGALGLYSGSIYFLINETIGWQEMGKRQHQVIQNNQYWWRNYAH